MVEPLQPQYTLRAELRGHLEDVRGCLSCELGIATASRDKTIKLWVEDGADYMCMNTFVGHTNYVGPLAYLPADISPDYPTAALVSGSRDTNVMVWDPDTAAPLATLAGHTYQVTGVAVLTSGEIVSGALDKTVRVWKGGKAKVLEGHAGPVLAVVALPTGEFLSGSGDMTIKRWQGGKCVHTYKGHTDSVRGLAVLQGGGGFVSASHDMTCKVWSIEGEVLAELVGHTALVYAVACMEGGIIASGSEDNTVRVWTAGGQCLQVIEHLGCVWDLAFTPEGDLITGCADSVARVWSAAPERQGPPELAAGYAATLASIKEQRAAAAAGTGEAAGGAEGGGEGALPPGVKVEDAHMLQQPGTKDGQHKFVREASGAVSAYSWDAKGWQWEKIGEVVSAPSGPKGGAAGEMGVHKKYHLGQEWDFVFDVDVQEGAPVKKLALNRGENPYIVADRFLEEEDLPREYKEQIVQFIISSTENAGGAGLADMPITGGGFDPFTGGGSSGPPPPSHPRPPVVPLSSMPITGGFMDPFTGGSGETAPGGGRGGAAEPPPLLFLAFDGLPAADKLAAKVREFSAALAADPTTQACALSEQEAAGGLTSLLALLPATTQGSSAPLALTPELVALLAKMLGWPAAQLFPALDVARLLALHAQGAAALTPLTTPGASLAQAIQVAAGGTAAAALQLALRVACNAFKHTPLQTWVTVAQGDMLDAFAASAAHPNKAVRLSWATLLYNISVLSRQQAAAAEDEAGLQVLSALVELLGSCPTEDSDTLFRGLQAATILVGGNAALAAVAKDLGMQDVLRRVHEAPESRTPEGRRVLEAAVQLTAVLK